MTQNGCQKDHFRCLKQRTTASNCCGVIKLARLEIPVFARERYLMAVGRAGRSVRKQGPARNAAVACDTKWKYGVLIGLDLAAVVDWRASCIRFCATARRGRFAVRAACEGEFL